MPAEAIRINRRVLLQCSIGAPGLKQPFAQPQQNGALSAVLASVERAANGCFEPPLPIFCIAANVRKHVKVKSIQYFLRIGIWNASSVRTFVTMYHC